VTSDYCDITDIIINAISFAFSSGVMSRELVAAAVRAYSNLKLTRIVYLIIIML
jgi:hypothetical protein